MSTMMPSGLIVIVLLSAVLITCGQASPQAPASKSKPSDKSKEKRMQGLVIGTFPKERAILPGESFIVETVFENRGDTPIEVANPEGPSQFLYELLQASDRKFIMSLSQIMRDERRTRDLVPPEILPLVTLQPGQRITWQEDLADFLNEGIPPGKYLLRAKYPHEAPAVESALAPVTVLAPKFESFSSEVCERLQLLTTVFAHRREDGGVLILQRDSLADPRESVFYRRLKLDPGSVVSVATAIDAVNAGNGRWFGWLREGVFEAAAAWGDRIVAKPEPLRLGDSDARLLSPGFQIDLGVAMFGIVTPKGRLQIIRATPQGLKTMWQGELGPNVGTDIRWNYGPETGTAVMWRDATSGLIHQTRFDPSGKVSVPPGVLTRVPVFTWHLPPLGQPVVRLIGTDPAGGYRYAVFRPGQPEPPKHITALDNITSWALCADAQGQAKVTALAGGKLWVTAPDRADWRALAETKDPAHLHAFAPRGRTCWAEWVEQGFRVARVQLP